MIDILRWHWAALLVASIVSVAHLLIWGWVPLTGTVSLVEAEWTLTALGGAVYSSVFLSSVLADRRYNIQSGLNGDRQATVEIFTVAALILLLAHLLFLVLGISAAMSLPNPTTTNTVGTRLVGTIFAVTGQSFVVGLARISRLRRYLYFGKRIP